MSTIRDVAKESGVSVATVSYVLNNGPRPVSAETRRRVQATMHRLRYHPNAMARGLVRRRMNTLGVLFAAVEPTVVTNPYATGILEGILATATDAGFNITIFTERWKDARSSATAFRDRRTDGILVISPSLDSDMVSGLHALDLKVVAVSFPSDAHPVPSVDVDNERGGRLAAEHLLNLGHTRIAHLSGDPKVFSARGRQNAFCAALVRANVEIRPEYLVPASFLASVTPQNKERARQLLQLPEPPTAIFAGNDGIALAVLEVAREMSVAVPEQLSVVGFDDIPAAELVAPGLTTIRQPLRQIGAAATRLLIAAVEGEPAAPTLHLHEPELIVRGSTAPPA